MWKLRSFCTWIAAVAVLSVCSISCGKEDPTVVVVTVLDSIGQKVPQASVRLFGLPTDSVNNNTMIKQKLDSTQLTDSTGQARYDLSSLTKPGQAGFLVLNISASKESAFGVGIINVEENKTNFQSVSIQ